MADMTRSLLIACFVGLALSQTNQSLSQKSQDCPAAGGRKDCGWYGVTNAECSKAGCCYEETPGQPYCFYRSSQPDCPAVGSRKDCGWYGVTSSQCKAKGCCYEEVPGQPYCFESSGHSPSPPSPPSPPASDDKLINDFYNVEIGIAVSMLSWDCINNPGDCGGNNGQDRAVFIAEPDPTFHQSYQQAMSITHSSKQMSPYGGNGSPWGVALRIDSGSNFWKHFQVNANNELCALPHDGYKCGGSIPSWRQGLVTKSWASYDWFKSQKNSIVSQTHDYSYNEFDTAGMSSTALAGLFTTTYWDGIPSGQKGALCSFFGKVPGVSQKIWPVYSYSASSNSLKITDHLHCNGNAERATEEISTAPVVAEVMV